ncbi:MAG: aminotransferase class I/II-fold pyridoxal phosphate-dependent enzyme [Candidatus Rokuibacteriota bacterium]|nr:MAG: aminotransferase class I/II-fold pyridoxal phosphate-dependent enzyme [Candidatus Rokubacteria bacterium]
MHDIVDLRSDTLTLPTPAMREAMARAEVGDDVWGEDPTVQRLEATAAARLGKEAGLFVASGTMGNLVSVVAHTQAGQEVVLDLDSHIYNYEVAGGTVVGNVQMRPVKTERGFLTPEQVQEALRPANIHIPPTGLVCLENTHNRHGGTCCAPEQIAAVAAVAHAAGVPVHMDGARLFNAAVALEREPREFAQPVDSLTFCLSKGLGAPVGSVVCGSAAFIERAKRIRKMVGGGMRQAGILAAAGLISLDRMVDRLAEDHVHARTLAEAVAAMPGLVVDLASVQTNIVIIRIDRGDRPRSTAAAEELVKGCAARKVKIHAMGPAAIRCVTHKDVDAEDIRRAVDAFRELTARW